MDSPSVVRRRQEMAAFAAAQAQAQEQAPPESACPYCRGGCPYCQAVPESEAAPEPAAERPSLLSRLTSWRASQEPEEDTPAAPAREEAGSATQIRAPEAAEARAKSAAAAADEESGAAEKSGADWRPAYALALAAALVVCVMQLLALMPHRHWSSVIFEFDYRFENTHWDVAYDLWEWVAWETLFRASSKLYKGKREGSSCSASVVKTSPRGLGGTACAARHAARAGTIICLALAFMVSGALAKWFRNPAWTTRGKSPEWRFMATGGALAVGGAMALGFALFYSSAQKRALKHGARDECPRCEHHGVIELCDECGVVECSQGCNNAIAGGALALFAGCAMVVYAGCCHDCADTCCFLCPESGPMGQYNKKRMYRIQGPHAHKRRGI